MSDTYYCVKSPEGAFLFDTTTHVKDNTRHLFLLERRKFSRGKSWNDLWKEYKNKGYKVVKVKIVEVDKQWKRLEGHYSDQFPVIACHEDYPTIMVGVVRRASNGQYLCSNVLNKGESQVTHVMKLPDNPKEQAQ